MASYRIDWGMCDILPWDSCAVLVCQESILGVPEWYCVLSSLFLLCSETPVQAFDYYENLYVSAYIVMCILSWAIPRKEVMRSHRRCMFPISRDSNNFAILDTRTCTLESFRLQEWTPLCLWKGIRLCVRACVRAWHAHIFTHMPLYYRVNFRGTLTWVSTLLPPGESQGLN